MDHAPTHNRMDSSASSVKYPLAAGAAGAGGVAGASAAGPEMSQTGMAYQNIPSEQYWANTDNGMPVRGYTSNAGSGKSKNRKWKIAAIVIAVVAIIAIVVGVVVSQVTKKSGSGNSGKGSSSSGNGTLVGSDPSVFDKDPNLHQSFWAMAYTPQGAILPNCNVQLANVTRDIQVS
jgi:hypothetical protein